MTIHAYTALAGLCVITDQYLPIVKLIAYNVTHKGIMRNMHITERNTCNNTPLRDMWILTLCYLLLSGIMRCIYAL
jgi:hypothetical protein